MHYNEPSGARVTRNPLSDKSSLINTITQSKKSSVMLKQSFFQSKQSVSDISKSKESIEFTFQPKFFKNNDKKRSLEKFIKDQEKFLSNKELKIQQLRNEINRTQADQMTGTPQINRHSKQLSSSLTSTLKNIKFLERISRQKIHTEFTPQQSLFSPKILQRSKSMIRKMNVSTLLYEDAKRRQEKQVFMFQSQRKQRDLMMSPKINKNTNVLVLKRIYSQFKELVTQEEVNPLIALSVLQEIFNIDLNPSKQSPNHTLIQRLLAILIGNNSYGQIRASKMWGFIKLIIMGQLQQSQFTKQQEKEIIQNYSHFYKERITKERKTISPDRPTFRPKTLASSNKLANSFRQKTCQKLDNFVQNQKMNLQVKTGGYTIEDMYVIEHHKKLVQNEKKKIQKENRELQQCTFKPDISPSTSSLAVINKKPKIALRAPTKTQYLKTQYTQNSFISQQKQQLNKSKLFPQKSRQQRQRIRKQKENRIENLADNIKDVQKVIMRMSVGRQKRQFSNKINQRGYPKNQNWAQYQRDMHRKSVQNSKKLKGLLKK